MSSTVKTSQKNYYSLGWLIALALTTTQCGGEEGTSSEVELSCRPCNPVVINSNLTITDADGDDLIIIAPWFEFGYNIENDSDNTLVLVTFQMDISTVNNSALAESTFNIDPNNANPERTVLATVLSGEEFPDADADRTTDETDNWYVWGLPESDSFRYRVIANASGWFNDSDGVPDERLVKRVIMSTR